jgi:hypothetical protein
MSSDVRTETDVARILTERLQHYFGRAFESNCREFAHLGQRSASRCNRPTEATRKRPRRATAQTCMSPNLEITEAWKTF